MKVERIVSVPLMVHDPYFSIWSEKNHLYDGDTVHWSGKRQKISGYVVIDEISYCFMGEKGEYQTIQQISLDITPTSAEYTFENAAIVLSVRFLSPLLLTNPVYVSRPCSYVDVTVKRKRKAEIHVIFLVSSDLIGEGDSPVCGGSYEYSGFQYGMMGKTRQSPLGHSGDDTTIEWGYVYLAGNQPESKITFEQEERQLKSKVDLGLDRENVYLTIAYDDMISINYFGQWRKAYWTTAYKNILDAIQVSLQEYQELQAACRVFDEELIQKAEHLGGTEYALLCSLSYRQAVAAHKLIQDEEGNLIFLSKENDSNGCIGTVDVSYPSVPLFLLYSTEYVKGMLRPIFRFADCDVWNYEFAPHDVGRYPYAWGQVYGLKTQREGVEYRRENGMIYPPYYQFPDCEPYDVQYQMPVEECGNMLIMTAICCELDKSADFAVPYEKHLRQWAEYLLKYGCNPGEQLCTDDFAGHLAHNTNLAVKAIMGMKAYSRILELLGQKEEAEYYAETGRKAAAVWEISADAGDHFSLVFGDEDSWSLKYNLVWDRFFGSSYFSKETISKEISYYIKKCNPYGVPLDNRESYTKSDWICWCAALAEERETFQALISPLAAYVRDSRTHVPFSDWYDTISGNFCHFIARSVQGGVFMPVFVSLYDK